MCFRFRGCFEELNCQKPLEIKEKEHLQGVSSQMLFGGA